MEYEQPIDSVQSTKGHRFECMSPKLGRRVVFFDRWALDQWVLLEADPSVIGFCERPCWWIDSRHRFLVDFWIATSVSEYALVIDPMVDFSRRGNRAHYHSDPSLSAPQVVSIRTVCRTDVEANRIFIGNWQRILAYLTAYRRWVNKSQTNEILQTIAEPTALGALEERYRSLDIMLLRTAIFMLLHQGLLNAPMLKDQPLDSRTLFNRVIDE